MSWAILSGENLNLFSRENELVALAKWWNSLPLAKLVDAEDVRFIQDGGCPRALLPSRHATLPANVSTVGASAYDLHYHIVSGMAESDDDDDYRIWVHGIMGPKTPLLYEHGHAEKVLKVKILDLMRDDTGAFAQVDGYRRKGSASKDMWYVLPSSARDAQKYGNGEAPLAHVTYRTQLMMTWWDQRANAEFMERDGPLMLEAMHTPGHEAHFFDLYTERGRAAEHTAYWALAFSVAHDPQLWDRWDHWEHALLSFRMRTYFCRERHMALFLRNDPEGLGRDALIVDDPGERERQLYVKRSAGWAGLPNLWLSVPLAELSAAVAQSLLYDVDEGRVIITHHEFGEWAWGRARIGAHAFIRATYVHAFGINPRGLPIDLHRQVDFMVYSTMSLTRDATLLEEERDAKRRRQRRQQLTGGGGGGGINEVIVTGNANELVAMAQRHFPPCMARHVYAALVHGRHPKHEARLALSMFLIEAGFTVDETERVLYLLYEADGTFIKSRYPRTGWTKAAFKQEYGGQVAQLYTSIVRDKRVGAYGCKTLTADSNVRRPHGCPLAGNEGETRSLLGWIGVADIEDVMRFNHPQERCCRHFQERHPDDPPLVVKHPNAFFRRRATPLAQTK